jgi:hypothetical protein
MSAETLLQSPVYVAPLLLATTVSYAPSNRENAGMPLVLSLLTTPILLNEEATNSIAESRTWELWCASHSARLGVAEAYARTGTLTMRSLTLLLGSRLIDRVSSEGSVWFVPRDNALKALPDMLQSDDQRALVARKLGQWWSDTPPSEVCWRCGVLEPGPLWRTDA